MLENQIKKKKEERKPSKIGLRDVMPDIMQCRIRTQSLKILKDIDDTEDYVEDINLIKDFNELKRHFVTLIENGNFVIQVKTDFIQNITPVDVKVGQIKSIISV